MVRELKISKKANKFILSLPERERRSVKAAIEKLISNDTETLDIKRLLPYPKEFRLRVGNVRILFRATKEQVFIFKAGYRGGIYKQ